MIPVAILILLGVEPFDWLTWFLCGRFAAFKHLVCDAGDCMLQVEVRWADELRGKEKRLRSMVRPASFLVRTF